MYIGVLMAIAGWLVAVRSPALLAYGLIVGCIVVGFVRFVEEPLFRRRFGLGYRATMVGVSALVWTLVLLGVAGSVHHLVSRRKPS
jgi:protein-S-isoprenylcysteine O-methyltransferase Ste14